GSDYSTPGWKRAQAARGDSARGGATRESHGARGKQPVTIEGEVIARSSGGSRFVVGARVFHLKFGPGSVAAVDGNKLTVDFDKAGRKMVLESFVEAG
ncbi:MAG: ATP-dependent DNA helicase, partial [Methylocystis sp.]